MLTPEQLDNLPEDTKKEYLRTMGGRMNTVRQFVLITTGFILSPVVAVYVSPIMGLILFGICAIKVALTFMEDL